jgi:pimeloyl-ACP methyl ester carboxylesterase
MLLAYDDQGPGPAVVLLHGFPFDRTLWAAQVSKIGGTYRVITPDLRGFGDTPTPTGVYAIDDMADDVLETIEALHIMGPVVVGGLSMGGYVALSIAVRYPTRVRGLILADTRAGADTPAAASGREATAREVETSGQTKTVVDGMLGRLFSPLTRERRPEVIERVHSRMVLARPVAVAGALRGMASRPDRTPDLPGIVAPTLVMVGEDDAITPPSDAKLMADAIPNATLAVIPGGGHLAPLENSAETNRVILEFLTGLE